METPLDHVLHLAARLKSEGVRVEEVLKAAKVDHSTWTRWKAGRYAPKLDSWLRVSAEAEKRLSTAPAAHTEAAA